MEKINFIAIKKYPDKKEEMHVFTKNGEEKVYSIFDNKEMVKNSFMQLKKLAEENGIAYSSAGLRELRKLELLYYLEEKEFDERYPATSEENKNQAQLQKKKQKKRNLQGQSIL